MTETQIQFLSTRRKHILILLLPILLVFLIVQSMTVFSLDNATTGVPDMLTAPGEVNSVESYPGNMDSPTGVITDEYKIYLPIVFKPVPVPTLLSVGLPTTTNGFATYSLLVTWQDLNDPALTYQLEESTDPSFSNPTVYDAGTATSYSVSHPATTVYHFYYRVRAISANLDGNWSNTLSGYGVYGDDFSDNTTGWSIRRQDTDDTQDTVNYQDGKLRLKIGGRWDSIIASPMVPTPPTWDGYRINTRVQLGEGIDNLHSYGIVFGGDWDPSQPCPNSNFTSCFNRYYRLNAIWHGAGSTLKVSLTRVDSHDTVDNSDEGVTLMEFRDIFVGDPDGWNSWTIDVYANGRIKLSVNGNLFYDEVHQQLYISGGRYFGSFASSNEYSGTAAFYEFYTIEPIP